MYLAIVPLRLAWNCVKAYVVSPSHLLCWIWQASLVLGRVSVCGKPIVSISTYQSEIIDFTWLEAHPQLQNVPTETSAKIACCVQERPFDLSRFLEEVHRTERCARKHVGPFENVSYSVGGVEWLSHSA